ncbi:InlB B-repeat-containing protein [Candidatus Saccharibacteria bacterium]|nr:InlB B-repeat-containing protein [Candidatus Saccharibacteria bacterium]
MSIKHGDTLIEVAIAIAIFSLVAIGVVSVVNGSTSAAQSALEVTVSREEIDAQAEALRFIHTSYITGGNSNAVGNDKYKILWEAIKARAIGSGNYLEPALEYNPTTCAELYDTSNSPNYVMDKAFVIDAHSLGSNVTLTSSTDRTNFVNSVVVGATDTKFRQSATYPRLLYGADNNTLLDNSTTTDALQFAEGIFIVAIKDQDTTIIVDSNNVAHQEAAFYDFYIRTCWFTPGADRPSTVSTVVRLQDPDTISYDGGGSGSDIANSHTITFAKNDGTGVVVSMRVSADRPVTPPNFTRSGYVISGWQVHGTSTIVSANTAIRMPDYDVQYDAVWTEAVTISFNANGGTGTMLPVSVAKGTTAGPFASGFTRAGYQFTGWGRNRTSGVDYSSTRSFTANNNLTLYAIWQPVEVAKTYTIYFNANGGTGNIPPITATAGSMVGPFSSGFTRAGYQLAGWSTSRTGSVTYGINSSFTVTRDRTLYAVWKEEVSTFDLTITLSWYGGIDLDSYFVGDGFTAYYGTHNNPVKSGDTLVTHSGDITGSNGANQEITTATNLRSDQTYYYYVKDYTNRYNGYFGSSDATVTVNGNTFTINNGNRGNGPYWNVFVIKNGQVTKVDTVTQSPKTDY